MEDWYRAEIKKAATPLIAKWEPVLGLKVDRIFVQRIMAHLLARRHAARFVSLVGQCLPN
jgi:predicted metal-dependent hydrolase